MSIYIYLSIYLFNHLSQARRGPKALLLLSRLPRPLLVRAITVSPNHPHMFIYIYLSIYLSIHPSIYPSIHPSIYLSIYLKLVEARRRSSSLSPESTAGALYYYKQTHTYVYLYLSIYLSIHPSIHPSTPSSSKHASDSSCLRRPSPLLVRAITISKRK